MYTFRTPETEEQYAKERAARTKSDGCPLCTSESLIKFSEWRIIANKFPYDRIAKRHHLLIPKRHAADGDLSLSEREEFENIKHTYAHEEYGFLIEVARRVKSIPEHSHLHLINAKDEE